jgi:hypothetical protein
VLDLDDDDDDDDDDDNDDAERRRASASASVAIDANGRVAGADALDFSFRSFPRFLLLRDDDDAGDPRDGFRAKALLRDATRAFVGESFWLAADAAPRCALESLARAVFDRHVPADVLRAFQQTNADEARFGDGRFGGGCGAEWWTQVRRVDDECREAVAFHWDKDEDLVDDFGVVVHPLISTVTYLTSSGAPTVVLGASRVASVVSMSRFLLSTWMDNQPPPPHDVPRHRIFLSEPSTHDDAWPRVPPFSCLVPPEKTAPTSYAETDGFRGSIAGAFYLTLSGPHTTPFALCSPFLKDFSTRCFSPPTPLLFRSPPSTPFDSASDAFELRPDVHSLVRTLDP